MSILEFLLLFWCSEAQKGTSVSCWAKKVNSRVGCSPSVRGAARPVGDGGNWVGYRGLLSCLKYPTRVHKCMLAAVGLSSSAYIALEITSKLSLRFVILIPLFLAFWVVSFASNGQLSFGMLPILTAVSIWQTEAAEIISSWDKRIKFQIRGAEKSCAHYSYQTNLSFMDLNPFKIKVGCAYICGLRKKKGIMSSIDYFSHFLLLLR